MRHAKAIHAIQIVLLLLLTAGVLFSVVYTERRFFSSANASIDAPDTESVSALPEQEGTVADSTDSEETSEWLPPIVYEPYVSSTIDAEHFNETVILGNSQAQALSNFGLVKNADFVTRIGLSINHVLQSDSGTAPIHQLDGKQYKKAVFVFGENELGWPYPKNFISYYKKVIARVREMNPGVQVYVQAIFPVSAEHSEASTTGVTNENVRIFNKAIEEMCEEIDAVFMPTSPAFMDETGALPAGIAVDGVHFGLEYCKIWAGDLSAYLDDAEPSETTETVETTETTEIITQGESTT